MFFILSKTIAFLFMPVTIIIASLLLSHFVKHKTWKKRLAVFGLGLLILCTNPFLYNSLMKWWEVPPTPFVDLQAGNRVGIVLTGITKKQKDPQDRVYFTAGVDRVTHSIQLYRLGLISKIIIAGGSANIFDREIREAEQLYRVFAMCGIPPEDLIVEKESRNTHESAVAVTTILNRSFPDSEYLLVTSGYHMRRAVACFEKEGVAVRAFSTDFKTTDKPPKILSLIKPTASSLQGIQLLIREIMGFAAYKLAGYI